MARLRWTGSPAKASLLKHPIGDVNKKEFGEHGMSARILRRNGAWCFDHTISQVPMSSLM
jgi:hypothetical protein